MLYRIASESLAAEHMIVAGVALVLIVLNGAAYANVPVAVFCAGMNGRK